MYSHADLTSEIQSTFSRMEDESGRVPKSWLIRAVMAGHREIEGADRDFALYAAECHVTSRVERFFRDIRAQETDIDEGQEVLVGFQHVKLRYLVERNGETEAVHINEMTPPELRAKASQLQSHARGVIAHANELLRLAGQREQAA